MKKVFISSIVVLAVLFYSSCTKKKTNLEFDILYSTDLALPTMTTGITYTLTSPDVITRINDELAKNKTNANLVGEAKYTSFNVAVKTPTTAGLSFIKSIKFYINATNLPEQQISFYYNEKKRSGTTVTQDDSLYSTTTNKNIYMNDFNLKNRFMENSVYFKYKLEPLYSTAARTITITHNIHVKAITE